MGQVKSPQDEKNLREQSLRPYLDLREVAPVVMTAHASFPLVEGDDAPPATFSPRLIRGWLRDWIGYDGLVISDDLEMGAVSWSSPAKRALRALEAGVDIALFCQDLDAPRRARDEIAALLQDRNLSPEIPAESARRVARVLGLYPGGRAAVAERTAQFNAALGMLDDLLTA